ncbi:MAG: hypothetical protein Q9191_004061 [Dirinaria sp. TL-2023a]
MSISPIITFKAGNCEFDASSSPPKVIPNSTPGYLYLFEEDELIHFCWRPRSAPLSQPELDLTMVPADGHFAPYEKTAPNSNQKSPTNGRIFVLSFQSSTQKHIFWLQSKSQHAQGDPSWFSPRDLKLGEIVDRLLQGDEVNVQEEVANVSNEQGGQGGDDGDTHMEDAGPEGQGGAQGDAAGTDPFGGDAATREGEGSREGGADGGRAATLSSTTATEAVQNFLRAMQGNQALANTQPQSELYGNHFTTLPDLLPSATTVPVVDSASESTIDNLLSHLPPQLLLLSQEVDDFSSVDPNDETVKAATEALNLSQKREILRKALRSPQFSQSLGSLTVALRDGGLPSISDALGVSVENGGFMKMGGAPIGGGDAVEAFLEGIRNAVEKGSKKEEGQEDEGRMDTI